MAAKKKAAKKAAKVVKTPAAPSTWREIFAKLPLKQQTFIVNYLANGFNGTQAAKDAGYSAKTADSQASRLLKNAKVARVVQARARFSLAKREITTERTLDELAKIAYHDPRRFYDEDGTLLPIHELDEECGAALAGVDVKELRGGGVLKKIKHADKVGALQQLMRYQGLFKDKTEHTLTIKRVLVREAIKEERVLPPAKPEFE